MLYSHDYVIAAPIVIVGIAGYTVYAMRSRPRRNGKVTHKVDTTPYLTGTDASLTPKNTPDSSTTHSCITDETSILDEVDIYVSYGHWDQAAQTLRWYVDHHSDKEQSLRLLGLYTQANNSEGFVDYAEYLLDHNTVVESDIKDIVSTCLDHCPDNIRLTDMGLRMGVHRSATPVQQVNQKVVGSDFIAAQNVLKKAIIEQDITNSGLDAVTVYPKKRSEYDVLKLDADSAPLLESDTENNVKNITDQEQTVLQCFYGYSTAASMLCSANQAEDAIRTLKRDIIFDPRKLAAHVRLLNLFYQKADVDQYALFLLKLYIILGTSGKALRVKLLKYGESLGHTELWNTLKEYDEHCSSLMGIAEKYGVYVPMDSNAVSDPLIVEDDHPKDKMVYISSDDTVLQEFDTLLEYGQVDEAVDLLESAVLANTDRDEYYPPLLDMYERMSAYDRFSRITRALLEADKRPNESVMMQLDRLAERMQNGYRKDAA